MNTAGQVHEADRADMSDSRYTRVAKGTTEDAAGRATVTMHVTEPPLMQLTSRIRMARAEMMHMVDDLMRAQESCLDRMIGVVPKADMCGGDKQVNNFSGQFGELESAVLELEGMAHLLIADIRTQVHRLINVA